MKETSKIKIIKQTLQKRLLPPKLFIICVACMILMGLILPIRTLVTFPYNLLGIPVLILGIYMSIWGSNKFNNIGTNINTFEEPEIFVKDGLFQYTRHPMYLGFTIGLAGLFLSLGTLSPVIVLIFFLIITDRWYMAFEEKMMLKKFGTEYKEYQTRTRKWV